MSTRQAWHLTRWGRACLFLGSIRLAVPVLTIISGILVWGTWIESTASGKVARAVVYGSWWFIALMGLVCVILVAAVITRYPWKRRHTGFIIVHASLITLIFGGFWSLFERVEGRLILPEGGASSVLELEQERIGVFGHVEGQYKLLGSAPISPASGTLRIDDVTLRVVGFWVNTREERVIVNDGADEFHAVQVVFDRDEPNGMWVGQGFEERAGLAMGGFQVRILPVGESFTPAESAASDSGGDGDYAFVRDGQRFGVPDVGLEVFAGWTVQSVRFFKHAKVTPEGLEEGTPDRDNPALEVVLSDGSGTLERHSAFANFPGEIIRRPIQGQGDSGATLDAPARQRLVFESVAGRLRVTHVAADGTLSQYDQEGDLPWSFECGGRELTVLRHLDHARAVRRLVEAPPADSTFPSVLVRVDGDPGPEIPLMWKTDTPIETPRGTRVLRYGPGSYPLPFTVRLDDFRKLDYPGTFNAMAFESDVTVTIAGRGPTTLKIHMNHPFAHDGWKVYQSGFVGDDISIFSVMKDPGLPLTYTGCIGLCVGIFLTFFGGGLSWGHPGIPAPFTRRRRVDAAHAYSAVVAVADGDGPGPDVARSDRLDADPGRWADDAPGHVRQEHRRPAHGPLEVVSEARP